MKKLGRRHFFIIFSGFLFTINGFSQETDTEEWSGTLKREGKQKESVTFQVRISEEGPFILGMTYADTPFEFKEQSFEEDTLVFYWTPGNSDANCRLQKQSEGDFKGECRLTDSGKKIEMQIIPLEIDATDPDGAVEANGS